MIPTTDEIQGIPEQVFEKFLQDLLADGVSPEVVERLRTTLLINKKITESELKEAVLGEETL